MSWILALAWGFLGSLGFALLFNIHSKRCFFSALGGLAAYTIYLLAKQAGLGEAVSNFLASMMVSLWAESFSRILKTTTTTFLLPGIVPLVPGSVLYRTMNYAITSRWKLCFEAATLTVSIALSIAFGLIVVTSIFRFISKMKLERERFLISHERRHPNSAWRSMLTPKELWQTRRQVSRAKEKMKRKEQKKENPKKRHGN